MFLHWRWPALRSKRLWFSALAGAALVLALGTWWSVPVAAFLHALALSQPDYRRALIWLRVPATLAIIVIALGAVPLLFQPNDLIHRSSALPWPSS